MVVHQEEPEDAKKAMTFIADQLNLMRDAHLQFFPDQPFIVAAWTGGFENAEGSVITFSHTEVYDANFADALFQWNQAFTRPHSSDCDAASSADTAAESTFDPYDISDSSD